MKQLIVTPEIYNYMNKKNDAELNREPKAFDDAMQSGKMKWTKKRNKMSHLTPKKKKRK